MISTWALTVASIAVAFLALVIALLAIRKASQTREFVESRLKLLTRARDTLGDPLIEVDVIPYTNDSGDTRTILEGLEIAIRSTGGRPTWVEAVGLAFEVAGSGQRTLFVHPEKMERLEPGGPPQRFEIPAPLIDHIKSEATEKSPVLPVFVVDNEYHHGESFLSARALTEMITGASGADDTSFLVWEAHEDYAMTAKLVPRSPEDNDHHRGDGLTHELVDRQYHAFLGFG